MSTNSERITAHNARLAAMKETVAALPEAGGGAVETCTVTVTKPYGAGFTLSYTTIENDEIIGKGETLSLSETSKEITMIKNSVVTVIDSGFIERTSAFFMSSCATTEGEILLSIYEAIDNYLVSCIVLMHSDGTITLS